MTLKNNFYGRRMGRPLSIGKRDLMTQLLPRIRIDNPHNIMHSERQDNFINFDILFSHKVSHFLLEIGYGHGEHLSNYAQNHPNWGIVGCDPFANGTAELLETINEVSIKNIRLWNDTIHTLMPFISEGQFDKIVILFPDPWPKLRHHKRRLIQVVFVEQCIRTLRPQGELIIATDHNDYLKWIINIMCCQPQLEPCFEWLNLPTEKPYPWPVTTYETKALREHRTCNYLKFKKV